MATLGKPPIATPPALDLRSIQQAIDNIRERFVRLEAQATQSANLISGPQAATSADLSRQITVLRNDLEALAALVAGLSLGDDAPDLAAQVAQIKRRQREAEDFEPRPLNRATMLRAVAETEAYAPEAPWRHAVQRLAERVDALEQGQP